MAPGATHPGQLALLALLLPLLGALLPGLGGAEISMWPLNTIIPKGGSMKVNCSVACDGNITSFGLETHWHKTEVDHRDKWKIFELSNVENDGTLLCHAVCQGNQTQVQGNLTVYWFPEYVKLANLSWQREGQHFNLSCQVSGGAPRTNLSAVLFRGEEELFRQSVGMEEPANVTFRMLASRKDHGANFSCRTELNLQPQGLELFWNSSAPLKLQTYVLPATHPHLATPELVEVGTPVSVNCSLDGLFPASEATVHLARGDHRPPLTITHNGDSLLAKTWINGTEKEQGTQYLVCEIMLADEKVVTKKNVTFYSFPPPNLTLSEPEVSEGTTVSIECQAHGEAVVTLNEVPAEPPSQRAQLKLNVSAEDHGRSFSCSAALTVAGHVLYKNQTQVLSVLYGPRLDERDCPGNWTWPEGSHQTLTCQARGNPTPKLICRREGDGALLPTGDLGPVKREITGTYQCQATSSRGVATRVVVVNVIHNQNNMVIIIPVAAVAILGSVGVAAYIYNYQRKIQKYELQKAQENAAMKLSTPASPP
ncbi:intercellular adhesion molecule 1 precursor [Sus scrofa]|uniref:Intercellular adhesion molecule 1 n=2 Tax=Sus scrofa TaxID=9823 RepID=Q9MZU5_PIG|nr:intercellular adhesion molecule 1 precursor [Sus scrofa]AAF80287.1 intercellular adhesion molecule-1 precursor [Sus scrofa]